MNIEYYCPRWGSFDLSLRDFFEKAKSEGYDGVEIPVFEDLDGSTDHVNDLLEEYDLKLIAQQWMPYKKQTIREYMDDFENRIHHLVEFSPEFINSHTGRDYFSVEQNSKIFERAFELSEKFNISIIHETHRGRALFSTHTAKTYFDAFKELKINADFSHWCVVSESLLEDQPDIIEEACKRSAHIHARVGASQTPQVNHPAAPENQEAVRAHLKWWQNIIDKRKAENHHTFTITLEFGPQPYLPTLPFTNKPMVDQWEINVFMMHFLREHLDV